MCCAFAMQYRQKYVRRIAQHFIHISYILFNKIHIIYLYLYVYVWCPNLFNRLMTIFAQVTLYTARIANPKWHIYEDFWRIYSKQHAAPDTHIYVIIMALIYVGFVRRIHHTHSTYIFVRICIWCIAYNKTILTLN